MRYCAGALTPPSKDNLLYNINMKDIVFDLGAVLIDWNPRYFYRQIFTNEADMEYFLKEICNSAWCLEMDGGKTFAQACAEKAAQYPQYADPIKKYDADWQEMLGGVVEGTVQILRELKQKGSRVYALTNWSAEKFPIARAKFDFLKEFDGIVVSGEEKCVKPHPQIFQILLSRYGLQATNCIFTDDNPTNIQGAQTLGFDTILFTSPENLRVELHKRGVL